MTVSNESVLEQLEATAPQVAFISLIEDYAYLVELEFVQLFHIYCNTCDSPRARLWRFIICHCKLSTHCQCQVIGKNEEEFDNDSASDSVTIN